MPYLEYGQQTRSLGPGVLTIGSGTEAGWRILDHDLLPVHVIIAPERNGRVLVVRGAPGAAVSVNGEELEETRRELHYGDVLRLGTGAELRYRQTLAGATGAVDGFLHDTRRGRVYRLGEVTEIGRDLKCAVLLPDPDVSREHAVIAREGDGYVARPVGSAYTALNGRHLTGTRPLREGDELSIGRTVLRFSTERPSYGLPADSHRLPLDKRQARMQTMYVGTVQAREIVERHTRRKIFFIVAALAFIFVVLALVVAR